MGTPFAMTFAAGPDDIDVLGHVNNAVWVRWMEAIATAHWFAVADPAHVEAYVWVVTRHEIDYRGNVALGETVHARTWIEEPPKGARFDRHIAFASADGRELVRARTTWAMVDKTTGRLTRIAPEIAAPFMA
jgi:acyl-CoA thioester hydrolase